MSRITIINGHPGRSSISRQIAESYAHAATGSAHEVRINHLCDLQFDADHGEGGYRQLKALEPDLQAFLDDLKWAEHIVLCTPMWWGGLPAKLKGLVDRSFLPGRTFDPRTIIRGAPKPLLTNRTGRIFVTSDTPGWAMALFYRSALFVQLRRQIFGFVGIKPARITHFNTASHAQVSQVERWLQRAADLGAAGK